MTDHTYSKHWSEKVADTNLLTIPCSRILFDPPTHNLPHEEDEDEILDVDGVEPVQPANVSNSWRVSRPKCVAQMNTTESLLLDCYPKRSMHCSSDEEWLEDVIKRRGVHWSKYGDVLTEVVNTMREHHMKKEACKGAWNDIVVRNNATIKAAENLQRHFRPHYRFISGLEYLHCTLMEDLSIDYLLCYVEMMQVLHEWHPQIVKDIIDHWRKNPKTSEQKHELILRRTWGPASTAVIQDTNFNKVPKPVTYIFVPCIFKTDSYPSISPRYKFYETLFKQIPNSKVHSLFEDVDNVEAGRLSSFLKMEKTEKSMVQILQSLTLAIKQKIVEVDSKHANRKIVLVGWDVTSIICCHAALQNKVDAVICFGFPLTTMSGDHGGPDDRLSEMTTPVMIVTGNKSYQSTSSDVEHFRHTTLRNAYTNYLLVGGDANDFLRLPHEQLNKHNLTQNGVDRLIFESCITFQRNLWTPKQKERTAVQDTEVIKRIKMTSSLNEADSRTKKAIEIPARGFSESRTAQPAKITARTTVKTPARASAQKRKSAASAAPRSARTAQPGVVKTGFKRGPGRPSKEENQAMAVERFKLRENKQLTVKEVDDSKNKQNQLDEVARAAASIAANDDDDEEAFTNVPHAPARKKRRCSKQSKLALTPLASHISPSRMASPVSPATDNDVYKPRVTPTTSVKNAAMTVVTASASYRAAPWLTKCKRDEKETNAAADALMQENDGDNSDDDFEEYVYPSRRHVPSSPADVNFEGKKPRYQRPGHEQNYESPQGMTASSSSRDRPQPRSGGLKTRGGGSGPSRSPLVTAAGVSRSQSMSGESRYISTSPPQARPFQAKRGLLRTRGGGGGGSSSRSSGAARMSRDAREQPQQPHGIVYNTEPSPRGQYFESDDDGIQSIQVVEGPKAPQPSKFGHAIPQKKDVSGSSSGSS